MNFMNNGSVDGGNVNPTQHKPSWLRYTTKCTSISLVRTVIWTRNSRNASPVWALCSVHSKTSQSAGAGIRVSIFNSSNDATVRTREVPLVHATCDVSTQSRTRSHFTQAVGRVGNLLCGRLLDNIRSGKFRRPSKFAALCAGNMFRHPHSRILSMLK